MNASERNVRLTMVRENLNNIPEHALPAGYSVRWYQPGDEKEWLAIHTAADTHNHITSELYARAFGGAEDLLKERQCFLIDSNDRAIGTATAWFHESKCGNSKPGSSRGNEAPTISDFGFRISNFNGASWGRVHWVAIVPEQQGRGLAKPLMTVVCHRLRELGHTHAYLTTSRARVVAINLYRTFGFVPMIGRVEGAEM